MFKNPPEKPVEKKLIDNFSRYTDPTGEFTNRDLQMGEWYVKHRIMLREIVVTILAIIIVIFGGYSLYRIIEYTFFGYRHDERVRADLTKTTIPVKTLHNSVSATPLSIDSVSVYPSTPGKYDFVAMVQNLNDRWLARVTYVFSWDGGETLSMESVVLPNKKMPLMAIGVPRDSAPDTARLVIKTIDWQNLDNHNYSDPAKFVAERTDFTTEDLVFSPANSIAGNAINQIKFNLKNNTGYAYWEVPFAVVLKKGDVVVGVKRFIVDSLEAGEKRLIQLSSLVDGLDVDAIELYPDLDILDQENYQKPKDDL
ncbi:MAG: hypothetical protein A2821_01245 [Candidatus Magasanikbacteria bacterium RIFCSPHIGHO2_01_FULL_41_23]|uniref:Uncharacterized protein n=1 Tax=Candidatus Magasanikbacteria bacterium RIFCSPLOWO2_01_FULL_40_15 TaxID=1798686 RepID=A0A1F6N4I0_9BACT|nr:MAG: hypothetical protein A2821_01245 [Candidatus Magasanikbacteria bacterium RIFCSPHIGHO2_01_FULL_41_23]OGH66751.1 MAG: hypothetical protein A3C66_01550 [Candidatus Magasanikbacteria bacterium RIFCSPHIGHO2_02_FULL_41_35]OGH74550.1 MAG: hypothetical protein A3F22_02955 [Candidatus Magasanikbacteria bacterium RIFCSPHIGHO2_12_FULL_41_16]OGH78839.1 MAG: hypothetical protein A2983_00705 [Candidatus Magasanikbacteria bacterium RIFCSPLOWO2_01_FULL_40_15]